MPEVEIKADFQSNIEIVWNAVTDNKILTGEAV